MASNIVGMDPFIDFSPLLKTLPCVKHLVVAMCRPYILSDLQVLCIRCNYSESGKGWISVQGRFYDVRSAGFLLVGNVYLEIMGCISQ